MEELYRRLFNGYHILLHQMVYHSDYPHVMSITPYFTKGNVEEGSGVGSQPGLDLSSTGDDPCPRNGTDHLKHNMAFNIFYAHA
ncbi:hypothetical protein VNO77_44558 [Canavalia gladiata]|uniref:Uncharacterized protein n=1 Tax=Canavalia gladiata TaxID=3824 RepID=A0AAN9JX89_CANGL